MTSVTMLLSGVTSGYPVKNSLRFRPGAYLSRTLATTSNTQIFTQSAWVKRGSIGVDGFIFFVYNGGNTLSYYWYFGTDNTFRVISSIEGVSNNFTVTTTQVFRDPSAWYHIVVAVDTTQATASNRLKMYVNGAQITSFSTANYPSQNFNNSWNNNGYTQYIGRSGSTLDATLAEVYAIDGQALTPSSFGTYDTNGVWQPIKYSGSFGTNGFYLNFGNTTSTTTLGYDTSGNSNNWTTNNISLTAGSTYDSMTDSPTVSSASVANYAVMNPVFATPSTTYSNGNLTLTRTGSVDIQAASTFAMPSGKFYWELTVSTLAASTNLSVGIMKNTQTSGVNSANTPFVYWNGNGNAYRYGTNLGALGTTFAAGNVLGFALDMTAGTISLYKNNTLISTTSSVDTTIPHYVFWDSYASGDAGSYNFGQQPYTYTPPTGFNALNTYNLPAPTIANGAQYMAATLYTGNGSSPRSITNGGNNTIGTTFAPDFVWIKDRSTASYGHNQYDVLRGVGKLLISNATAAEITNDVNGYVSSFDSSGFTLTAGSSGINGVNANTDNIVGWQWKANGTGVSNTSGSITSTVSANTTAGFSVVTYTGNTTAGATVGHGLGVAPNMIITKNRDGVTDWWVYHSSLGATQYIVLNTTAASATSANAWNNTAPTSTVFSLGASSPSNANRDVAYCWSAVAGYSAFGSYTGNGSTDGPFIYTGFRPRFIIAKDATNIDSASWMMQDTSRDTYNVGYKSLYANDPSAESVSSNDNVDILSNGFKIRNASSAWNNSGQTFIYAAFAENPFNSSRAR